ncbi:MAG: DNRLRE domain-containing protein [Candidatus Bathyarchaeota archaeon]|nr:DNRLRE domain-containing protein [Candidatus Bathyarchaeota archaeon]
MGSHREGVPMRINLIKISSVLIFALLLLTATAPNFAKAIESQTVTVFPVADAMCDSFKPDENFGYASTFTVGVQADTSIRKYYAKFDLSSFNLSNIISAKLRFLPFQTSSSFAMDIHECEDYWQEPTICWNNAPFQQSKVGDCWIGDTGIWYELNVTSFVKTEYDKVWSVVFTNQTAVANAVAYFFSREDSQYSPRLIIEYIPQQSTPPSASGGQWTLTGVSGNWSYSTDPLLLAGEGWNASPAFANFTHGNLNKTFADGEGFQINFTVSIQGNRREWWWIEGTKRFYFSLGIHGTNDAAYTLFYIAHEQGFAWSSSEAKVGTQQQYNIGKPWPSLQVGETVDTTGAVYYIQVIRVNATTAKVVYATNVFGNDLEITEGSIKTFNETLTVDSSVWDNPVLNLYAGHDGSGTFECVFGDVYVGTITGFEDQTPTQLNPNPFQWLIDGFNFIWGLATMIGAFAGAFLPILPWIFLFYALDVIVTSVQVGSVQPIGKFALMIWEFLLKVWFVLVRIGQLIWDAITFWT